MSIYNAKKAWLLLADGTIFEGRSFGAEGTSIGEVVFTTTVVGCQETLTDPNYYGQIAVQTFPLIGNYGTNDDDVESDNIFMKGYIVREWCDSPSNFRAKERIDEYLKEHNTIGLFDIDTRALTRKLRVNGVMNGAITTEEITESNRAELLKKICAYSISDAINTITAPKAKLYPAHGKRAYKIALIDFGYKRSIRERLRERGCDVTVLPATATAEEIKALGVDGILLSNGPGDPAENTAVIENVKEMVKLGLPMMGVCLGHQIMALAMGAKTKKMGYGHRGGNQPVIDLATDKTHVTTQNHGHVVLSDTLDPKVGKVSHINANDKSCEGIEYLTAPMFSIQFHPESCDGPADTSYLYNRFLKMIDSAKEGK